MPEATGNCFENCARQLIDLPGRPDVVLVHAQCTGHGKIAGEEYGHAFLLIGNQWVMDMTTDRVVMVEKDDYYRLGNVREIARYTRGKMFKALRKYRHFGPWHPKMKAIGQ